MTQDSLSLARRVRRAARRWPLTELDPIERGAFSQAVRDADRFEDLDRHWQELILRAEAGHPAVSGWAFHALLRGRRR